MWTRLIALAQRLRSVRSRHRVDDEARAEFEMHLALLTDRYVRAGMTRGEADAAARRQFGNALLVREDIYQMNSLGWFEELTTDAKFAFRLLAKSRGFTILAALTLALGIGAATTIFTVAYAVVLRPLPFDRSEELVVLQTERRQPSRFRITTVTAGDFLDWEDQSRSFKRLAAFNGGWATLVGAGVPETLTAAFVSSGFFETLAVAPTLGSTLAGSYGRGDLEQAVMISAGLWRRRFNADPAVIGRAITLDGNPRTVAGVLPDGFNFPADMLGDPGRFVPNVDLWMPLSLRPGDRGPSSLHVIGRLKPDVTIAQAQTEMSAIAAQHEQQHRANRGKTVRILDLQTRVVGEVRPLLLVLLGAVGLVLVMACANVANLLMARAATRSREIAVRRALGAPRSRLMRQLLTENLFLALTGGAAGWVMAFWGLDLVGVVLPRESLPRLGEVRMDADALMFAIGVSLLTGVLFGMVPALRLARLDVFSSLKETSTTQTPHSRVFDVLVVSQVAVACVLLIAAGLTAKSFIRLAGIDPGFEHRETLAASVSLPERDYEDDGRIKAFSVDVLDHLRANPSVDAAAVITWLPFTPNFLRGDFSVEGDPEVTRELMVSKLAISAGYFDALGIARVAGRDFNAADNAHGIPVAIVPERLAQHLWPGQSPIGKRLKLGFGDEETEPWLEVVGVVAAVRQAGLASDPDEAIYVPLPQAAMPAALLRSLTFVVHASADSSDIAAAVLRAIHTTDSMLPVNISSMDRLVADSVASPRFRAVLFGFFGVAAITLTGIGIFGVLASYVASRSREISVRLALGARRIEVLTLVLKRALRLSASGVALGVIAAVGLTRLLTQYLFEVRPLDLSTFAAAVAVIGALALTAAYLPAQRASMVDPLNVLRGE